MRSEASSRLLSDYPSLKVACADLLDLVYLKLAFPLSSLTSMLLVLRITDGAHYLSSIH
jgi:hypothetical protein